MKKILTILLFALPFFAQAQSTGSDHIESSGTVRFFSGALVRMVNPNIYVTAQYDNASETWTARLEARTVGSDVTEATYEMTFTDTEIDALTPDVSSVTNTEITKNVILQAVVVRLIAVNGSIFAIV